MNHTIVLAGIVLAQSAPLHAAEATPTDPAGPAAAVTYRSAFEGYRRAAEEPVADWRALNDEVGRVGGHLGIMRGGAARPGAASPKGGAAAGPPGAGAPHRH